jgi:hypothetical protein
LNLASLTAEEKTTQFLREQGEKSLNQSFPGRSGKIECMGQVVELFVGRPKDLRIGVADIEDPGAAEKVDIDISVQVFNRRAAPPPDRHGQSSRVGYGRSLEGGLKIKEPPGTRAGRRSLDQRRSGERIALEFFSMSSLGHGIHYPVLAPPGFLFSIRIKT